MRRSGPSARRSRRAPSASSPSATPVDGLGAAGAPRRAAQAVGARGPGGGDRREAASCHMPRQRSKARGQDARARRPASGGGAAMCVGEGWWRGARRRRALRPGSRRCRPRATGRPSGARPDSTRMPADLAAVDQHVVGPLQARPASAGTIGARPGRRRPGRRRRTAAPPRPAACRWQSAGWRRGCRSPVSQARPRRPRPAVWRAGGDPQRAALARLGAAAGLGVGGVDLVEGDDRGARCGRSAAQPRPKAWPRRRGQRVEPGQRQQHDREGEEGRGAGRRPWPRTAARRSRPAAGRTTSS